ncbi:CERK [Mytilus edulis]|uniref:CERK n=1 Tax=Mytilus edulis TaxID=6550 RepID=A0A8S3QNM3_MYTED|nr:CERK [Mytilus edulis]
MLTSIVKVPKIIHGELDWVVNERVSGYGDNVTLFCLVDDCCKKVSGWIKFDPDYKTIFLDVQDFKHKTSKKDKYAATTNRTGFGLVIKNVRQDDFNIKYLCSYGFKKSSQKVLSKSDVFKVDEPQSKLLLAVIVCTYSGMEEKKNSTQNENSSERESNIMNTEEKTTTKPVTSRTETVDELSKEDPISQSEPLLQNDFKISLKDILVVKEVDGTSDELIVEIHYIKHELHRLLKMESIRFRAGASEATYFHILMDDVIQGFSRPRKLLVFINPISGRKKGLKIYRQQMAPICKLCGIECSVIVTNRRGQALEILDNYDLSSIDGIVTVGGDGIFSECVNGLLRRHQAEHNVDIHDTNSRLQPCNIPLGVLPAGSGNVLLELLHGNKDVQTAVLRIILGDVTRTNVAGVYQGGVLSVYACLILGFGLCGRMVRDCEKTRWMGPRRYSIAPLKALLTRKMYDVEVSLLKKDNESFIKKSNRIVTRTKSYDVRMGKSSVRKQKQHLVINRSKSLDIYENSKFHAIERGRVSLKSRVFSNVSATSQTRRNSVFKSSNRIASNQGRRVSYKHKNTVSDINNQPINSVQSSLHVNGSIKRTYSGQNNLFRTNERVDKVYQIPKTAEEIHTLQTDFILTRNLVMISQTFYPMMIKVIMIIKGCRFV